MLSIASETMIVLLALFSSTSALKVTDLKVHVPPLFLVHNLQLYTNQNSAKQILDNTQFLFYIYDILRVGGLSR